MQDFEDDELKRAVTASQMDYSAAATLGVGNTGSNILGDNTSPASNMNSIPEVVLVCHSMGFSIEACQRAYAFVGDDEEQMLSLLTSGSFS